MTELSTEQLDQVMKTMWNGAIEAAAKIADEMVGMIEVEAFPELVGERIRELKKGDADGN